MTGPQVGLIRKSVGLHQRLTIVPLNVEGEKNVLQECEPVIGNNRNIIAAESESSGGIPAAGLPWGTQFRAS